MIRQQEASRAAEDRDERWTTWSPDGQHLLEEKERSEAVRDALAELSERDQEILLLWDAGLDYEMIAAQTGLAKGAIGTTLARARKRLVEAFDSLEGRDAAQR